MDIHRNFNQPTVMAARVARQSELNRKIVTVLLGFVATLLSVGNLYGRPIDESYSALTVSYTILTVSLVLLLCSYFRFRIIDLLRPSTLAVMYTGLSMTFGSWFFQTSQARSNEWLDIYFVTIRDVVPSFTLIAFSFFAIFLAAITSKETPSLNVQYERKSSRILIYVIAAIIAATVFIIDRFVEGGLATLKVSLTTLFACLIFLTNARFKWPLMGMFIILLAAVSFNSKREAVFLIPCVMVLWLAVRTNTKVSFSNIIVLLPTGFAVFILILAMSILRGYGNYDAVGLLEAIRLVPDYVQQDFFLSSVGNNFEFSSTFFHLTFSTDSIINTPSLVMNGETYLRTLFIGPIGDLAGFKPPSILESYTAALFPSFRAIGGSYPITSIGEAVWNFAYFAPFFLFGVYFCLDRLFAWGLTFVQKRKVFGTILFITFVELCLFYTRGSGVDLVTAYFLVTIAVAFLMTPVIKLVMSRFSEENYYPVR